MTYRYARAAKAVLIAALALAAGCSGNKTALLPPSGAAESVDARRAAAAQGNAVITIVVPTHASSRVVSRTGRRPAYVSVSTKGMTIAFLRGGKSVVNETIALSPGSLGCKPASAGTRCNVSVPLNACGSTGNCYLANVSTYDDVKCKGKPAVCSIPASAHELSTEQKYPVGISAGHSTQLTLTLAGIPVAGKVVSADAVTRVNAGGDFDLIGSGAHALAVEFLDADGEIIAGSGAPSLKISAVSGGLAPVVVATPASGQNEIYVTPPGTFDGSGSAAFTVTPSFAGQATNGCKASNADCTPLAVEVDMVQMATISSSTGLQIYALGEASPLASLQGGLIGLAIDGSGNLYTGDSTSPSPPESLVEFSPPLSDGMAPTRYLSEGQTGSAALKSLVQIQGGAAYAQLYTVTEQGSHLYSFEFCSSAACVPSTSGNFQADSIAADAAGDTAQVQSYGGCVVSVTQAGNANPASYQVSQRTPCAQSMVFDARGDLFMNLPQSNQVAEIFPGGFTTLISTGTTVPYQVGVDGNGDLLCAGQDSVTLAATLQETLVATLNANEGGTIPAPDHSIVIETPSPGDGTASEALAISGNAAYVQYSFLNGTTGRFATFMLPGLTKIGSTISNAVTMPNAMVVSP